MGGEYQEKGRRFGPGHAGRGALLDDVLHGHGGQGRIGGGGPPPVRGRAEQTLWGLEDLEPRIMEDTDNDSCARCT